MPAHTDKQYERELNELRAKVLRMGALVETMINEALVALAKRDKVLSAKVVDDDHETDQLEMSIDDLCVKLLALHQPAASDLRFITASLRIGNDLERMGDLAVSIARKSMKVVEGPKKTEINFKLKTSAQLVRQMVQDALDAFVTMNVEKAEQVLTADDRVDSINHEIHDDLVKEMQAEPEQIPSLIYFLLISRHLERLADHATNIAELVVFLVKGQDIRHQS